MTAEELAELVGEPVRDALTGRTGAVRWTSPPGMAPSVLVRWDDGGLSAYAGDEVGSRLVRNEIVR